MWLYYSTGNCSSSRSYNFSPVSIYNLVPEYIYVCSLVRCMYLHVLNWKCSPVIIWYLGLVLSRPVYLIPGLKTNWYYLDQLWLDQYRTLQNPMDPRSFKSYWAASQLHGFMITGSINIVVLGVEIQKNEIHNIFWYYKDSFKP